MTRVPIQLDFSDVLLTFTGDMFGETALDHLTGKNETMRFRTELAKLVQKIPADIARIDMLGSHGIAKYEFDEEGNMSNHGGHISGLGPFYLMQYDGGALSEEGNLMPNPGQLDQIVQRYDNGKLIPIYKIDFGTYRLTDDLKEEDIHKPMEEKFDSLRKLMMGIGEGIDDFAVYLVRSQEALNIYHDYNSLERQKIQYDG